MGRLRNRGGCRDPYSPGCRGEGDGSASQRYSFVSRTNEVTYAPEANDDEARTWQGRPVELDLLANDRGEGMRLTDVSAPSHGTLSCKGALASGGKLGKCLYTPDPGFEGVDYFGYAVEAKWGRRDVADVGVLVLSRDLCPDEHYIGCGQKGA